MSKVIALVDDDLNIRSTLSLFLEAEGYTVRAYRDGVEAYDGIYRQPPALALVDIKMPRMDGMELLEKVKASRPVPFMFLTSKDDELDELIGLRQGADDFIRKPFSQRLVLERIRAVLRRHSTLLEDERDQKEPVINQGDLLLDPSRHLCSWKEKSVDLTVTEFLILKLLARHPGHVKTREIMIDQVWGHDIYVDDRSIDSHVKRIRKKFKNVDETFANIETLYGLGYRYRQS